MKQHLEWSQQKHQVYNLGYGVLHHTLVVVTMRAILSASILVLVRMLHEKEVCLTTTTILAATFRSA